MKSKFDYRLLIPFIRKSVKWGRENGISDDGVALDAAQSIAFAVDFCNTLAAPASEWRPIEMAPKRGKILLQFAAADPSVGQWEDDKNAVRPRPFWKYERWSGRTSFCRENQPIGWMPLPAAPAKEGE